MNNEKIKEIQNSADIVDIISSYISLEKKGANYVGLCPFHNDSNPSFTVSPEKKIYTCWVCKAMNVEDATGGVFNFVKKMEQVSFMDAVKIVADKVGIEFNNVKTTSKYEKHYEVLNLALKYFQNNLKSENGLEALKYLHNRKLDDAIIDEFEIGFADQTFDSLTKVLKSKEFDEKILINTSLCNLGNTLHDFFINRITFPIHNVNGLPIGFSARIYDDSKESKYINTKESPIFKKGEILFNFHRAKKYAIQSNELIIVEGQMDAIRVYANGIKNVVALMGTALTSYHINILKKLKVKVLLCFDNDQAGIGATLKNGESLIKEGIDTYVISFDNKKDSDEYILEYGIEKYENLIKNKVTFFEYKMNYLKKNKNLSNEKDITSYVNAVIRELNKETDDILINVTVNKLSNEYNIDKDIIYSKIKKKENDEKVIEVKRKVLKNNDKKLSTILYYMMNDAKYIELFNQELSYLPNEKYLTIAQEILAFYLKYNYINIAEFITEEIGTDYYEDILDILDTNINVVLSDTDYLRLVNETKLMINEAKIEELKMEMKKSSDVNQKLKIADEIAALKSRMCNNE